MGRWGLSKDVRRGALVVLAALFLLALPWTEASATGRKAPTKAQTAKKKGATATSARGHRKAKVRQGRRATEPPVRSVGQLNGLHGTPDPLDLKSSVALVVDQETNEILLSKNPDAVLPIASLTKLMTALVVVEAALPMGETIAIEQEDLLATAGNRSRLQAGTRLSRGEMLRLALMSSENRAANALSRYYPGGGQAFVEAMNRKAAQLGMRDTRYVEPTGLSSDNRSSANDLSLLVKEAARHPIIGELSTSTDAQVAVGSRQVQFRTTNRLVVDPSWAIDLQKTGYIAAAGRCLVMQAELAGRKLIMVLLDSAGAYSRLGDAERIRKWLARSELVSSAESATTASTRHR